MVKNISPFRFGQVVDSAEFTNRHQEFALFEANLLSGNNLIIMSPRRYVKSSLVRQFVLKNTDTRDVIHCMVDLFSVQNEEEFYEILSRELIKASSGKFEEWLSNARTFFSQLIPRISIGSDPLNDFSVSFDVKEIKKHKTEVLNLPERIAIKKNKRIIVYLDEFQNIGSFDKSIEFQKLLRSVWQNHKNVSYCMYGSKRHMMREIFEKTDRPFYRFGSQFVLGRIDTPHWQVFIREKFNESNKTIRPDLVAEIITKMGNHPHYVQQMAHFVWSFSGKNVSNDVIDYALEFMLNSNSAFFVKIIEELSKTQINLLKAISNGEIQLTSARAMRDYNIGTPRNIVKNRQILEGKDIIDNLNDKIVFIDPLFEIWFRKNIL